MTVVPPDLDAYLSANAARIERELFDFLRIPSVSARSEHDADTARAAEWTASSLRQAGLEATVHPTKGHPVVVGQWRGAPAGAPTILVYGHYDVQPAEPLELWTSPAFEPTVRDGKLFARGSVDDKGQLFLHIKALEAHLAARGTLPVNVIVVAEGEEEVGSEHLAPFIEQHAKELKADAVVISDSAMFAPGLPSVLSSLRGLAYFQLDVQGPAQDLHSGSYGGAVVNPAMALARILATLHDDSGHIAIPGFYDSVKAWPPAVLQQMKSLPFDEEHFRKETGAPALGGERGFTVLERLWTRPTCEVNGLLSGYTGEGAKTGRPAQAMAKVSCRLVPGQDPAVIEKLMAAHVARVAP
jgi:acetylornithine deacetylase/succinyl-diaminopimelate desuccinylase-like protein